MLDEVVESIDLYRFFMQFFESSIGVAFCLVSVIQLASIDWMWFVSGHLRECKWL